MGGRQGLDGTDLGRWRGRLIGQVAVEPLEVRVGEVEITDAIVGVPLDGVGDLGGIAPLQQDWNESGTARLIVVNAVVDQVPLPPYAEALAELLLPHDAASVGLAADHQNKVRLIEARLHPARPALVGSGDVLIEDNLEPAVPQSVCQVEDAFGMLRRVLAVADKDLGSLSHEAFSVNSRAPRRGLFWHSFEDLLAHDTLRNSTVTVGPYAGLQKQPTPIASTNAK